MSYQRIVQSIVASSLSQMSRRHLLVLSIISLVALGGYFAAEYSTISFTTPYTSIGKAMPRHIPLAGLEVDTYEHPKNATSPIREIEMKSDGTPWVGNADNKLDDGRYAIREGEPIVLRYPSRWLGPFIYWKITAIDIEAHSTNPQKIQMELEPSIALRPLVLIWNAL